MPKLRHSLLAAAVSAALPLFAQAQPTPDLDNLTAAQAAADICAGKYTSEALVGAALARAKARADLNAFITLDEAGALKAAKAADATRKGGSPASRSTACRSSSRTTSRSPGCRPAPARRH